MAIERPIRVLVIDDSPANRRAITAMLESAPGLEVVDRAADGEEGLKKAIALKPDCITLDLEMPRLDGYSFLRLLQSRAPTPVIVLSSYGHPADVFKALQLGAFDFVAKPPKADQASLDSVRAELIQKVRAAPLARRGAARPPADPFLTPAVFPAAVPAVRPKSPPMPTNTATVVAIGASTGGPPAVQKVLEALAGLPVCVLVAQHMPSRFTEAFAQRLDGALPFRVQEAQGGEPVAPGRVYIAPGGAQLELVEQGSALVTQVSRPAPTDPYAPSVDRLFSSVAKATKGLARGVVLTGMGSDGGVGVKALLKAGAEVWVESEETAVVFGMPQAAIVNGPVTQVLPLHALGPSLAQAIQVSRGSGNFPALQPKK
ncbi:MAG: chemotaxis-specific protein-glutamate methyltransferase CheB [Myxococcaceae bacterium]|nr:chemotaxis-specific protein-glutamate methyltransferase CheB [Myxococcaceae bacterium]